MPCFCLLKKLIRYVYWNNTKNSTYSVLKEWKYVQIWFSTIVIVNSRKKNEQESNNWSIFGLLVPKTLSFRYQFTWMRLRPCEFQQGTSSSFNKVHRLEIYSYSRLRSLDDTQSVLLFFQVDAVFSCSLSFRLFVLVSFVHLLCFKHQSLELCVLPVFTPYKICRTRFAEGTMCDIFLSFVWTFWTCDNLQFTKYFLLSVSRFSNRMELRGSI